MKTTLPLNQHTCFALYSASLAMTKVYKPLLSALHLTYPQYLVMLTLWEKDACNISDIGELLFLDSGTLTPLLKNLEALNYIQRKRSAQDERCVLIHLTAAGKALHKKADTLPACIADASGCTIKELADLTRRLQALRTSLQAAM